MKKSFLLSVLSMIIFITVGKAQDNPTITIDSSGNGKSFTQNMTEMIAPLDKSQITTGLLADKAFILSSMDEFNGQNDSVITLGRWKQIYRQLYNASISEGSLVSPDSMQTITNNYLNQDIIPIAILDIKYNEFKPYALDSNLVQIIDGKLYDVPGRNQSPYNEKHLFATVLLKDKIYQGQVNFRVDNNFFVTNNTDTISSIEIDFGDGRGFIKVLGNNSNRESSISVNYTNTNVKTLTTRITYSSNTIFQSKSNFMMASTSNISPDATYIVSGYLPYDGSTGTGTAYVLYGCGNNNQLRKPIIVSDGFDPTNARHFNELYELLNKENFVEKARAEGFDFVILDYNSGADYIQRNAYVLISLIRDVNSQLLANGSNSQLVVVGPSMAGLISRYALYYMEQNNLKHNTRLYISFDSPHLGANIPLGDQHWLDFFATYAEAQGAIDGKNTLNTPAAQQMLVYHFSSFPYTHSLRTTFINDTYYNFPSRCRKIAIANGSGNNTNFFNPCEQIINYVYHVSVLGDVVKGSAWAVPSPSNGLCKIFEGKIPTQFLLGAPVGYTKRTVKVSGTKPYDSAPGGSTNANEEIADGDTQGRGDITTNYPYECFIPTISALALSSTDDLNYYVHGIDNYPYPQPSVTPFNVIFSPSENQEHVKITIDNIVWIMNEAGAFDLYLQNQTVTYPTDFESRNTIKSGNNVTNSIQQGDFIVQNTSGVVNIRSGQSITLRQGTSINPKESGSVQFYINHFPCPSASRMKQTVSSDNVVYNEIHSINQASNDFKQNIKISESNILLGNYPNPCIDYTNFEFNVKEPCYLDIMIYNSFGQRMDISKERIFYQTGKYIETIDMSTKASGIYFCI